MSPKATLACASAVGSIVWLTLALVMDRTLGPGGMVYGLIVGQATLILGMRAAWKATVKQDSTVGIAALVIGAVQSLMVVYFAFRFIATGF